MHIPRRWFKVAAIPALIAALTMASGCGLTEQREYMRHLNNRITASAGVNGDAPAAAMPPQAGTDQVLARADNQ